MAEAGANVAIVYRSSKKSGDGTAAELQERNGVKAIAYQVDVSSQESITYADFSQEEMQMYTKPSLSP